MSRWNQPICERDWIDREGNWTAGHRELVSLRRMPVRVLGDALQIEQCAWCGQPTILGAYVRADPATVDYPAADE